MSSAAADKSFAERVSLVRPVSMSSDTGTINDDQYDQDSGDGVEINQTLDQGSYHRMNSDDEERANAPQKKSEGRFKRTYTLCALVMLGFGNTIGSGIFTLTGVAAKTSGAAAFLGFIISGFIALLTALVFAEFSSIIPKSGSSYLYTYTTFGELPAWIVGWNQNLRYGGTTATQSRGFSEYAMMLFVAVGLPLPEKFNKWKLTDSIEVSPMAVVFLVFVTAVSTAGTEIAGKFNHFVTSGKLFILGFLVISSLCLFEKKNFEPFLDEEKGFAGVIQGSTILFFGYLGFDFITTIADEAINPKRDVPRAILLSVVLSMLIYACVAFSVQGVGNLAQMGSGDGEAALGQVFEKRGYSWMSFIIFVCAILGISAAGMTNLMSQSRILYSYAKDGLFFQVFKEIDPVRKIPIKGAWLSIIPICIAAFFMNLKELAQLCSLCNLMTYAFIDAAVIALRLKGVTDQDKLETDLIKQEVRSNMRNTLNRRDRGCGGLLRALRIYSPWSFLIISLTSAVGFANHWAFDVQITIATIMMLNLVLLTYLICITPTPNEDVFRTPLVPLTPCLGIYSNFLLCTIGVELKIWYIFFAFEGIGVFFYVIYGYHKSKLPQRVLKHQAKKLRKNEIQMSMLNGSLADMSTSQHAATHANEALNVLEKIVEQQNFGNEDAQLDDTVQSSAYWRA